MGTGPGQTIFFDSSNANRATLGADGGLDGTFGGVIFFADTSTGGLSVVRLFDHGRLDISLNTSGSVGVGSIEGNGYVLLGGNNLAVGRNNFSTSFSGKIRDGGVVGGTGGSLTKEGNGTLTLACVGSYTGGTIINSGTLLLKRANTTGSGPVQVNGGTLAGDSTILGPVTIGTGTGAGAIIAPGGRGVTPATLTIANTLTLNADGSYAFAIDTNSITADQVVAAGVTIASGATLTAATVGTSAIPVGTVLTAISNTAATPITGTFSNLPDGGTIIAGNNIFQASYSGGDGNDLTLTVVP
jgi:autotransporter-associated beta strand protein